jgi:methionyl-tRNA synthetase
MKTQKRKILATAALPYSNGDIHLGHLVEYLQADFWTRFQKMSGNECLYICADDTHGTPIMVRARQEGITPEELIARSYDLHVKDFSDFQISFDNYSSTHTPLNQEFASFLFTEMEKKEHVTCRSVEQHYCDDDKMFLPDRFIKGICPKCDSADQYGDSCDNCGATYDSADLKEPSCALCGSKPNVKASEHIFFKINDFKDYLRDWLPAHTSRETANKLLEWFDEDLRDWDISRDAPYFGFEIPGHEGKYFYVWLDAPIGYMASTREWCERNGKSFDDCWNDPDGELYHFIGKDIVRFHCLFWPAILHNASVKTPDQVFVHGFLIVNGEKMSKSKGTFINARTYLNHLDPMYLRFYYACKLNSSADDIDLSMADFVSRVNSDLFGKITNLASRGAQMLNKHLDGRIGPLDEDGAALVDSARSKAEEIAACFEGRDFGKGLVIIRDLADEANRYFDDNAPWKLIKTDPEATRAILSTILNVFRILAIYLKPILPAYVAQVEQLFAEEPYSWNSSQDILNEHTINEYKYLASRVEQKEIDKIMEETKQELAADKELKADSSPAYIEIEDLQKIDLRVAEIVKAEAVEGADKLLSITIDLGGETRQVFAGIKTAYDPATLKGRLVAVVANLKPRKMRFGVSEAMILAAGTTGEDLFLLSPDSGAKPGHQIK